MWGCRLNPNPPLRWIQTSGDNAGPPRVALVHPILDLPLISPRPECEQGQRSGELLLGEQLFWSLEKWLHLLGMGKLGRILVQSLSRHVYIQLNLSPRDFSNFMFNDLL